VEELSPTASAKRQSRPILHESAATTEVLYAVSELLGTIRGGTRAKWGNRSGFVFVCRGILRYVFSGAWRRKRSVEVIRRIRRSWSGSLMIAMAFISAPHLFRWKTHGFSKEEGRVCSRNGYPVDRYLSRGVLSGKELQALCRVLCSKRCRR
jgi:hypothetical protein